MMVRYVLSFLAGAVLASAWWATAVFGYRTEGRDLSLLWVAPTVLTVLLVVAMIVWLLFTMDEE